MMQFTDFQRSVVRIVNPDGASQGTGFLVGDGGYIVSAAHVIAGTNVTDTDDLPDFVSFEFIASRRFNGDAAAGFLQAKVLKECFVPYNEGDLAVLLFEGDIQEGIQGLSLGDSGNSTGQDAIKTFGFPGVNNRTGTYGSGFLMGPLSDRSLEFDVLQVNSMNIAEGFSGAPVLNLDTGNIIGFVSWIEKLGKAFIVPTEQIVKFLGSNHPVVDGADIAGQSSQFYFRRYHQLDSSKFFIDRIKSETVLFITRRSYYPTLQAGIDLLQKLKMSQTHRQLPPNITVEDFWLGVITYLQYSKIDYILQILEILSLDRFNQPEVAALKEGWKKVAENPYKYIFEEHLSKIISDNDIVKLNEKYIELLGELSKDIQSIDAPMAMEIKTSSGYAKVYKSWYEDEPKWKTRKTEALPAEEAPRIDSILNIARDEERFILIGPPGSGKTITLNKILYENSEKVLSGDPDFKVPVFITANKFNDKKSINTLIADQLPDWKNSELDKSKFLILIDGINEINPAFQQKAKKEIKKLLDEYERASFIISTRKYGFLNEFDLSLFELKPLQPNKIYEYIKAHRKEFADKIWAAIHEEDNSHLLEMSSNPLTLLMIIVSYDAEKIKILPENRGGVYKAFIGKLLESDKEKNLHRLDEEQWMIKERALSDLALNMRKKDFNPPLREVTDIFERTLGNYRLARNLLGDLCSSYVLRISGIVNGKNMDNHSIDNAPDSSTVSFVHETFLEYFCALEVKNYFIRHKSLDINFTRVEWFETILLAADLFEKESDASDFLFYLFNGGKPRKIAFKDVRWTKRAGRILLRADKYDFKNTFTTDYFTNFSIACKVAYSIRSQFPAAYAQTEQWLYRECYIWMQYAGRKYRDNQPANYEPYPVKHLLAAVAGLSSPALFDMIFTTDQWQAAWLIYEYTDPEQIRTDNVDAFIGNLSSFSLLYNFLIENDFSVDFGEETMLLLKEQLKHKMPLYLQKKFFEGRPTLDFLERIGKQDPEYFIKNFERTGGTPKDFVRYLASFSANTEVQKVLLKKLYESDLEAETRDHILDALLTRFFCVPELLKYIQEKIAETPKNTPVFGKIKKFVFSLPLKYLNDKSPGLYQSLEDILEIKYDSIRGLYKKKITPVLIGKKAKTIKLFAVVEKMVPAELWEYEVSFSNVSFQQAGRFSYNGSEEINYKVISKNNKKHYTIQSETAVFNKRNTDTLITINGAKYEIFEIMSPVAVAINKGPVQGFLEIDGTPYDFYEGSVYSHLGAPRRYYFKFNSPDNIDFSTAVLTFPSMAGRATDLNVENSNRKTIFRKEFSLLNLSGNEPDITTFRIFNIDDVHPEFFDKSVIDTIRANISSDFVRSAIKPANLTHIFHKHIPDTNFGIVLRVTTIYNTVEVYSPSRDRKYFASMPRDILHQFKEQQLVIIEDDFRLFPFQYSDPDLAYGFEESFVDNINEDYLFIYNPDCKDYFLHQSSIQFIPEKFDIVRFYPSKNLSKRYSNFPLASLVKRVGKGSYELKEQVNADLDQKILKAQCELSLEKRNVKLRHYFTRLLLQKGSFVKALENTKEALKIEPSSIETNFLLGECYTGLKDYKAALLHYRKVYTHYQNEYNYMKQLINCLIEMHNIKLAYHYLLQYFRSNRCERVNLDLIITYADILVFRKSDRRLDYLLNNVPEYLEIEVAGYFAKSAVLNAKHPIKANGLFEKSINLQITEENALSYALFLYKIGDIERSTGYLAIAQGNSQDKKLTKLNYYRGIGKIERIKFTSMTLRPEDVPQNVHLALEYIKQKKYVLAFKILEALKRLPEKSANVAECFDLLRYEVFSKKMHFYNYNVALMACYNEEMKAHYSPYTLMEYISFLEHTEQFKALIDYLNNKPAAELNFHTEIKYILAKAIKEEALANPGGNIGRQYESAKKLLTEIAHATDSDKLKAKYLYYLVLLNVEFKIPVRQEDQLHTLEQVLELDPGFYKAHELYLEILSPEKRDILR